MALGRAVVAAAMASALVLAAGPAAAQSAGVVVVGRPSAPASRLALELAEVLATADGLELVRSEAVRRALAGVPAAAGADDPLADVRRSASAATGEAARAELGRLGRRLDLDLLVTVARVGDEAELRAFDVERRAYFRGTLMVPVRGPVDREAAVEFVATRAGAGSPPAAAARPEAPRRQAWWSQWWVWTIVGVAVVGVGAAAYLSTPGESEDQEVRLRIVAP